MDHTHNLQHHGTSQSYVPSHERWWRRGQSGCHGDPGGEMQNCCFKFSRIHHKTPKLLNSRWLMQVRSDYSDLIDSTWVFSTHGELICQSNCISIKIFAAVEGGNIRSNRQHRCVWHLHRRRRSITHVTNWAVSCFVLRRRSTWRHSRKLSSAFSELMLTSM